MHRTGIWVKLDTCRKFIHPLIWTVCCFEHCRYVVADLENVTENSMFLKLKSHWTIMDIVLYICYVAVIMLRRRIFWQIHPLLSHDHKLQHSNGSVCVCVCVYGGGGGCMRPALWLLKSDWYCWYPKFYIVGYVWLLTFYIINTVMML
jgi:hypothetical protein